MNFFLLKFIWRIRHTEKTPVFKVGSEQNIYNRNKPIRLLLHNPMGLFLSHIQKPSANCKTAHKSTFCEKITVPKADRLRTSVHKHSVVQSATESLCTATFETSESASALELLSFHNQSTINCSFTIGQCTPFMQTDYYTTPHKIPPALTAYHDSPALLYFRLSSPVLCLPT